MANIEMQQVAAYIHVDLKKLAEKRIEGLRKEAEKQTRMTVKMSMSNYLEWLIRNDVEKHAKS